MEFKNLLLFYSRFLFFDFFSFEVQYFTNGVFLFRVFPFFWKFVRFVVGVSRRRLPFEIFDSLHEARPNCYSWCSSLVFSFFRLFLLSNSLLISLCNCYSLVFFCSSMIFSFSYGSNTQWIFHKYFTKAVFNNGPCSWISLLLKVR